jgi:hypothetical protein
MIRRKPRSGKAAAAELVIALACAFAAIGCGGSFESVGGEMPRHEAADPHLWDGAEAPDSAAAEVPADEELARKLGEQLSQPAYDPLPPVPYQNVPRPHPPVRLDRVPDLSLPPPDWEKNARLLPSERGRREPRRPVYDAAIFPGDLDKVPLPAVVWFPAAAKAFAPSPDPLALRPVGPVELEQARPGDDPTKEFSRRFLLNTEPLQRASQAPGIFLAVPDPYAVRQAVRLRSLPEDEPVPATTTDRPRVQP